MLILLGSGVLIWKSHAMGRQWAHLCYLYIAQKWASERNVIIVTVLWFTLQCSYGANWITFKLNLTTGCAPGVLLVHFTQSLVPGSWQQAGVMAKSTPQPFDSANIMSPQELCCSADLLMLCCWTTCDLHIAGITCSDWDHVVLSKAEHYQTDTLQRFIYLGPDYNKTYWSPTDVVD